MKTVQTNVDKLLHCCQSERVLFLHTLSHEGLIVYNGMQLEENHTVDDIITAFNNHLKTYKRDVFDKFNSFQSLDRLGRRGDMRGDSSFLKFVKSAEGPCEQLWHGQGCPLALSVQYFLCRPQRGPPSKVP